MMNLYLVAATVALVAQVAPAPSRGRGAATNVSTPVLQISGQAIRADGQPGNLAVSGSTTTFSRYVWMDDRCTVLTDEREPAQRPVAGWFVTVRLTPQSGDLARPTIEWSRRWESQRAMDGRGNTLERSIASGERIELDRISTPALNCNATAIRLEVSALRGNVVAAQTTGRGGRASPGIGRGSAPGLGGRAGGRGAAPPMGSAPGRSTVGGRGGAGYTAGRGSAREPQYQAEIWLVHRSPDGERRTEGPMMLSGRSRGVPGFASSTGRGGRSSSTVFATMGRGGLVLIEGESAMRSVQRFGAGGTGFSFPALTISTTSGPVNVIVTGTVSVRLTNGSPTHVMVTIRRATTTPDAQTVAEGTNGVQEIGWDKAREVVSFELPAPRGTDPLAGHKLEVRMRVTAQ
jgi:hypothetical protein